MRRLVLLTLCCSCATVHTTLAVTGAGQQLTRITTDPVDEFRPQISPDGKTLLFHTSLLDYEETASEQTIVGVDPDTGARRTLFTPTSSLANHPAWLPDGSSFVYASNAPGTWSLVRALSGAPNAAVTMIVGGEVAPSASYPTVAPDGMRVAFATLVKGVWSLAVVGLAGPRLTSYGEGTEPAWSPDGKRIAFVRTVGDHKHLYTIDPATGTGLVQLTSGDYDDELPSWSADSSQLVFDTNRGWELRSGGSPESTFNLFTVKPDGTGLSPLTQGEGKSISPAWGRDGWVYFASNQSGNFDIWRLRPATAAARLQVQPAPAPPPAPAQ